MFNAVLDYYHTGIIHCPPHVPVLDLRDACDYFLLPFNASTVKCQVITIDIHIKREYSKVIILPKTAYFVVFFGNNGFSIHCSKPIHGSPYPQIIDINYCHYIIESPRAIARIV